MSNKPRVVVVTGGGSGMGRAIAQRFAQAGDTVYALGRRLNKLQETAEGYDNIRGLQADVTDVEAVSRACKQVVDVHKTVDVLVNNAGGRVTEPASDDPVETKRAWDAIVGTNLSGVFYVTQAFMKHLARPGGRIINISSSAAFAGSSRPDVRGQAYSASKAGLHGISRTLARSLAPEGITVNCVAPGLTDDTEFFGGQGVPADRKPQYLETIPMGRTGEPEEIAAAVFFLASDEAAYITGEILNVNGGAVFGR